MLEKTFISYFMLKERLCTDDKFTVFSNLQGRNTTILNRLSMIPYLSKIRKNQKPENISIIPGEQEENKFFFESKTETDYWAIPSFFG